MPKWFFQKAQCSVWINIFSLRGTGCQPNLIYTMIKSYSLLTDQASAGQLFLSEYELSTKVLWSTKEKPFVMNSQNNSLIHQKALSTSVINSSVTVLFFLYLVFISPMSSASSDSQGKEIYKEAIASLEMHYQSPFYLS